LKQKHDRGKRADDADGVRAERRPRGGRAVRDLVLAVAAATVLATWLLTGRSDRPRPPAATKAGTRPAPRATAPGWSDAAVRAREVRVVARRRAEAAAAARAEAGRAGPQDDASEEADLEIDAGDYIAALRAGGETGGLAAFAPPGTNPPRSGVVVPEDYDLPEGFARHYQTTDDGRQLDPVLAVAPEYDLVDEDGNRIELHGDRIVPPELAPPDLPVRMLEVPPAPARAPGAR
jgi:hypothetical protein